MKELRTRLDEAKGRRDLLLDQAEVKLAELESLELRHERLIKARHVLTEVAKQTLERFKNRVESLITLAIRGVFDRPFEFKLLFSIKRNRHECKPVVVEGKSVQSPKEAMGGGILDIIGFAFRIVLWSLERPRSRNILILDEPMRWAGRLRLKAGRILKEISNQLKIQIIMMTHDEELICIADRLWFAEHDGVKSIFKQLEYKGGEKCKVERVRRSRKS